MGVVLVSLLFVLSGCFGSSTPDPAIAALTTRTTDAEAKITALETKVNALPNMSGVLNDITVLKADIVAIRAQLSTPSTYVTPAQLAAAVANWESQYNTLNTRVNSLDARVTVLEARPAQSGESVKALISGTQLALKATVNTARSMAFEFKYVPATALNLTVATYQLALDALYTSPPASMNVGVNLVPVYNVQKIDATNYQVVCVTFLTPQTALIAGENMKTITIGGTGNWEVRMLEVATSTATGGTW